MSDILISGAIILGCLFVFGLMAHLVVDSHKKALAKKQITITFTEVEQDQIIAAAAQMRQWSQLIKDQAAKDSAEKTPDPTIEDLRADLEALLNKQQLAIDNEDYELAAECRDELEILKSQLKKIQDDQTT